MSVDGPTVPLGAAIDAALEDAKKAWTHDHAHGQDPEVFLTQQLMAITATVRVGRGRQTHVYIEVTGKRPWQCETYGYRIVRERPRHWSPTPQRVT